MSVTAPELGAPIRTPARTDVPPRRPTVPSTWWDRLDGWVGLLVVVACCVFVLIQLHPPYLFRNTTPTGGDTGAHVWWPAYLRDHLLPWRLAGWAPDWYAGFPAGQFYFPLPAVMIVLGDLVLPYNIAFKIVTALGSLLLPAGAYVLGRGLRAPRPAPAAMAVAATAFLFFIGDTGTTTAAKAISFNQHIMGGNLASTMAGEFSFSLALALGLFFLGTFADSLHTRRRLWLPAALLAATVMSHFMVGVFVAIAAVIVWLFHRPVRNFGRAAAIGGVAALLTAVWTLPLLVTLPYTTDMRYSPIGECAPGSPSCDLSGQHYVDYLFPPNLFNVHAWQPYQWGAYALIAIALVSAIGFARRSTFVLLTITAVAGLLFRLWTDMGTKVWNLRALPFWYLGIFLLMGVALAELVRGAAWVGRELAVRRREAVDRELMRTAAFVGAPDDEAPPPQADPATAVYATDGAPTVPSPTERYDPRTDPTVQPWAPSPRAVRAVVSAVLTIILVVGVLVQIDHDKGFLPYWIKWNYTGYESVKDETNSDGQVVTLSKAYPEYKALMDKMDKLPPGRALWEGGPSIDKYGTSLALMLLPYWTHGRIQSMEGVYFEASATTPYHFEAVAALVQPGNASNPERGIPYRTNADFSIGVRYLQVLGVNYFLTAEDATKRLAEQDPRLKLVATTKDIDGVAPLSWSVYRVADSPLVQPLHYEPVVATGVAPSEWEQEVGVPWFWFPGQLDKPVAADGPSSWRHAPGSAALRLARRKVPAVHVTHVRTTDDSVSFDVDRTGVPVMVKTSFFPNWAADGASGPYRATPNFMVVVPTSHHVTLHYATTGAEWLGRLLTLLGVVGLVGLALWPRWRRRHPRRRAGPAAPEPAHEHTGTEPGEVDTVGWRAGAPPPPARVGGVGPGTADEPIHDGGPGPQG